MQKPVYFDYFYGEESEPFSYYRIPRLLDELDTVTGIGLIARIKQGQGHPTRICVKRFATKSTPQQPIPPSQ